MEYLSELYLTTLDNNYTEENVRKALKKCEECFDEKIKEMLGRTGVSEYHQGNSIMDSKRRDLYTELLDFWDVFAEFAEYNTYASELVRIAAEIKKTRNVSCRIIKTEGIQANM